jgi:hypothetical protein
MFLVDMSSGHLNVLFFWSSVQALEAKLTLRHLNMVASEDGVFPLYFHDLLSTRLENWSFVTVLRHPLDRIVSHCKVHGISLKKTMETTIEQHNFYLNNYYTRLLSLEPTVCAPCSQTRCHCNRNVTRQDLSRAKETLANFSVVLIMEWFAESAVMLKELLHLQHLDTSAKNVFGDTVGKWADGTRVTTPSKRAISKRNHRTHAKSTLSPAQYQSLHDHNLYDLELFEYAKHLVRCRSQDWLFAPLD